MADSEPKRISRRARGEETVNEIRQHFEVTVERLVDESGFDEWTLAELRKLHRAAYEAGEIAMKEKAARDLRRRTGP